jgi:large subunit ribosomal protein L29
MQSKRWNEIKNISSVELVTKLIGLQDKIFRLKFCNSTSSIKNPLEIRCIRRDIARIKTLISEKRKTDKIDVKKNRKENNVKS